MYKNTDILKVAFPVFLSLLAQNIINVTDTAFLGRVGEVELGASAMGGLFYICVFTIAFGFSTGSQIIIGRRNGERQYASIGSVVIQGIMFLFALAALFFLFTHMFAGGMISRLISSNMVFDATMDFLHIRMYGFFFSFFNVMFRALFVGITRTKVLTFNAVLMSLSNVLLDYLLIFGHNGFPQMGIKGAAMASVISEGVSTVFFLIYTYIAVDRQKYGLKRIASFDFPLLKRILRLSIFMMLQHFIAMTTFFLFFIVVERLGLRALAVANIVRSIYIVLFIPVNAFSTTTNTLVSNMIGAGRAHKVIPLIRRIALITLGVMLLFAVVPMLFPQIILRVYTNDVSLIADSIASLQVIVVSALIASIASIVFNGLAGTGDTRSVFMLEIGILVVYTFFIYLTGIQLRQPVHICFIVEPLYFVFMFIGSMCYLRFASWRDKRV